MDDALAHRWLLLRTCSGRISTTGRKPRHTSFASGIWYDARGLADRIGRSQSAIANKLRLLRLGPRVRNCISREIMTERHCRALLKLKSEEDQLQAVKIIHEKELSVRETEELVKTILEKEAGKHRVQRIVKVWRDARLLQNSVRQLVEEMRSGGAEVELKEVEGPDMLELTIRMRRKDGEGKAR